MTAKIFFLILVCQAVQANAAQARTSESEPQNKKAVSFNAGDFSVAGTIGGGDGSVPSGSPGSSTAVELGCFVSDRVQIAPSLGLSTTQTKQTMSGTTVKTGGRTQALGIALYYFVPMKEGLFLGAGPSLGYYAFHADQPSGGSTYSSTTASIGLNVRAMAMITGSLGFFGTYGIAYGTTKTKDTSLPVDETTTSLGLASYNAGVVFYFR
jgi:hypothetical protein